MKHAQSTTTRRRLAFLAALPLATVWCDARGQDALVVAEAPEPLWQRQTVEVQCGGKVYALALEKQRYRPGRLTVSTVNGRPSTIKQEAEIEEFLAKLAGATLHGVRCYSPKSLLLGISGSRLNARAGEEDDVDQIFLATFEEE